MIRALRRVFSASGWVIGIWIAAMLGAAGMGAAVRATVFGLEVPPPTDGHSLFALVHLIVMHIDVGTTAALAVVVTAIVGYLGWSVLAGLLILRLEGVRAASELGYGWFGTLGPVLVQTLWHLLLRALLLVILAVTVAPLGMPWNLLLLAAAWVTASLALDLTRIGVVRHGARRWHPATAAFGFWRALQDARTWSAVAVTWVLQLGSAAAILHVATYGIGPGSMVWATRGIALVGVIAGLWRLALAIERSPVRLRRAADDAA